MLQYVLLFLLMMSRSTAFSQPTPVLILPTEQKGSVQLNISAIPNLAAEKFGYEYLAVFVQYEGEAYNSNAVQGKYFIEGDYLVFSPYFPFEKGMTYVVRTRQTDTDSGYAYQSFQLEKKQTVEKAAVVSIYPSASETP